MLVSLMFVNRHAVVIGASIAGLCAARVLSDFYDQVSVYERDELPDGPANRAAVPQDRHVHILMARGAAEFGALFPGLLDDMVAAGVPRLENRPDCIHFGAAGHVLGTGHTLRREFTAYVPSRKQLEWQIRRRTAALPNVTIEHRDVAAPRFDAGRRRVTGVVLEGRDGAEQEFVAADLVVDATGRGTRLPVWLAQWGFARPAEETVDVGIGYATQQLRIPDGLIPEKVIVAGVSRNQDVGLGHALLRGRHLGTDHVRASATSTPPQTFAEMCSAAEQLLPESHTDAIRSGEPLGDIAFHRYPVSRWRRYDKLDRFPAGIVPFGDAVVSFNPTYGQGMTMTTLQAGHLRGVLASGSEDLAGDLARATAKTTFPVWQMNAIGDLTLHNADRRRAVVVPAGRCALRPVPRRGRDRSRSRGMVSAPVQPARQPLHGAAAGDLRPRGPAQHAACGGSRRRTARVSARDRDPVPDR